MTFVAQFNYKADILMEKLAKSADGKTMVNLFKEINHTTLDAIAQVCNLICNQPRLPLEIAIARYFSPYYLKSK